MERSSNKIGVEVTFIYLKRKRNNPLLLQVARKTSTILPVQNNRYHLDCAAALFVLACRRNVFRFTGKSPLVVQILLVLI